MFDYKNKRRVCNYFGVPTCKNFVYKKYPQSRSTYCDACKKLNTKRLNDIWRRNNLDKHRSYNRKSWRKTGYTVRKKRFSLNPELLEKHYKYNKEWVKNNSIPCPRCLAPMNYTSEYCRSCSNKINPRGIIKYRRDSELLEVAKQP